MRPIIFNKAGKLSLTKYVEGMLEHIPKNMCVRNGVVQSIQDTSTFNTVDMPDGNSDWPMGVYDTGVSSQILVTMSSYVAELHAYLLGVSVEDLQSTNMRINDEEILVPDVSPYSVKLKHAPNDNMTPILVNEDGSPFVKVSSSPEMGQFAVSTNVALFNISNAGENVYVTYDWTSDMAKSFGLPKTANRPTMYAVVSGEAMSEDESSLYDTNTIIDKCKATGDISPPQKGREPQPWSFTLRVLKPRGNNKAVDFKYARAT